MPESPATKFLFRHVLELDAHGVDVARGNILQNLVCHEDQLTNESTLCEGLVQSSCF